MKTLHLNAADLGLNFDQCHRLAHIAADHLLGGAMLLSFHDRDRDLESPAGVSECHQGCTIPGWQEYAETRGGELMVNFGQGRFVFCFRPLGEFA